MTEAKKWLEFERLQARTKGLDGKPLRPPVPADVRASPSRVRTSAFTPIVRALKKHGPMTAKEIAQLLKQNSHNVCGTIRQAVTAGIIVHKRRVRFKDDDKKRVDCYVYDIAM
jgi:predicted transcriptional regulator|tara:strand:+ start:138 stop:476 length:339 start_codon:yes stop_codon:yes gene_type:complete